MLVQLYVDLSTMEICSKDSLLKKHKKGKGEGFDLSPQDLIDMNAAVLGEGQTVGSEATGKAVMVDEVLVREFIPHTLEKLASIERSWAVRARLEALDELERVQDGHRTGRGLVSQWRAYRNALRDYPEQEGFPDTAVAPRPVAPT
jgi:hypothetical protein